jgi:hypothetical protein
MNLDDIIETQHLYIRIRKFMTNVTDSQSSHFQHVGVNGPNI